MTKKWKYRQPYFDKEYNWFIPNEVPLGGLLKPKLRPREWFCWILLHSKNVPEVAWKNLVGHKTTVWRIKKKLKEKGYL